jgi:predicted nuclease of restriction endonuclease-like (RecB) superfamily
MTAKKKTAATKPSPAKHGDAGLYGRVAKILEEARSHVVRTVNSAQVAANWLIGREIVEEEQRGERRAGYGEELIESLGRALSREYGRGFSATNLKLMRQFYLTYPGLLGEQAGNRQTLSDESRLITAMHPNLSWSHYCLLMKVQKPLAREFYESECIVACWSVRELERQISSLYYERLLMSKNRKKMILENRKPALSAHASAALEVIKDPYVLEFLGLPESHVLNETDLEKRLVGQLQHFLLELGQGFAFIGRQQRLTLEGDHFYADLVFYHTRLKCYVVIDLKTQKLTHADLGQMQLYVNYYDEEIAAEDDNPTLGLILCTDKNEAVCKYVLGKGNQSIFTSRYQLHLPTEEQLAAELRRELALIQGGSH